MNAAGGLRYDRYSFAGGSDEWLMRVGPAAGVPVLFVPPLFEELNRTRALIAATMRALAERGFLCTLPDLPGTGESPHSLEECSWDDWRAALQALGGASHVVAIRGGCLLDDIPSALSRWRLAAVAGSSLKRDLARAGLAGGADFAGYPIPPAMGAALDAAVPAEGPRLRTVRLASDPAPADAKLAGPALWRRSEPGTSAELALAMADDIALWIGQCGG